MWHPATSVRRCSKRWHWRVESYRKRSINATSTRRSLRSLDTQRQSEVAHGIADSIRRNGAAFVRVFGTSMSPTVPTGSIIHVVRADFASILPGAIVVFLRSKRIFVHRVVGTSVAKGVTKLITRGDALSIADPLVTAEEVLGIVTAIIPDWNARAAGTARTRERYRRLLKSLGFSRP